MARSPDHRARPRSRRDLLTVAAGVFAGVAAVLATEELRWRQLLYPAEELLLVGGILAASGLSAALYFALAMRLRPWVAGGLALTPVATLAAGNLLRHELGFSEPGVYALAGLPALAGGTALALTVRRWPPLGAVLLGPVLVLLVSGLRSSLSGSMLSGAGRGPDVLLIVLDTTRRDHLSMYGYSQPTSPSLQSLAADAEVYENAWSVAPWTPSSHASMLTGLLPAEHGVDGQSAPALPDTLLTLPKVLATAGYATGGFVANPNLSAPGWAEHFHELRFPWHRGKHSLARLVNRLQLGSANDWATSASTRRVLGLTREWWQRHHGRPRFALVNLLDPHRPYDPPDEYYAQVLGGVDRQEAYSVDQDEGTYYLKPGVSERAKFLLRQLYNGEVLSMDHELGRFLAWLRERGDLDRTVLVVTADHGERLGERGLTGHQLVMDQYLLRVPLLVRYPPRVAGRHVTRRVQLDGLPGYILELAGVAAPEVMAERALSRQDRDVVVAQYKHPTWLIAELTQRQPDWDAGRYAGDWSFVADARFAYTCSPAVPEKECTLVDMLEDPEWSGDRRAQHPEVLRRLQQVVSTLPAYGRSKATDVDPDTRDRLRSLGYVN